MGMENTFVGHALNFDILKKVVLKILPDCI